MGIQDWIKMLPTILDTRVVPLVYLLVEKSIQFSDESLRRDTTKILELLIERANPSLLSRFTNYVVSKGTNSTNHCWSSDIEVSRSYVEQILHEILKYWADDDDERDNDGGMNAASQKKMYLVVKLIWDDILKIGDDELRYCKDEMKWLLLFFLYEEETVTNNRSSASDTD